MSVEKIITIKADSKDAQKSFDKLSQTIQEQKDITISFEKELAKLELKKKNTSKGNLAQQKRLNDQIIRLKSSLKDQKIALKGLTNERQKANKVIKKSIKNTKDNSGAFSILDRATGGLASKFKSGAAAGKSLITSLKGVKVAIAATGIGALLLIFVSLIQAFKKTEAGQNKFAKLMGVIGSVVGNVTDVLSDLGMFIIDLFSGQGTAMASLKSFGKSIVNFLTLPMRTVIETVKTLGKVMGALFSGDVSGAFDALNNGVDKIKGNFVEVKNDIVKAKDALVDFGNELLSDAEKKTKIEDQRAKADKIERALIVEKAEANRKIADLRFKSEQRDKFSAKERVAFLKEASKVAEEISAKEIAANKLRLEAKIAENKLDGSTKADLNEVAQLKAKGIELDTSKLNLQKRLQTSLTTFQNEEKSGIKAIEDAKFNAFLKENERAEKRLVEEQKQLEKDIQAATDFEALLDEEEQDKIDRENKRLENLGTFYKNKDILDKIAAAKEKDIKQKVADAGDRIRDAEINNIGAGVSLIASLDRKSKALQAIGLIGEHGAAIAKSIISTNAANTAVPLRYIGVPAPLALPAIAAERAANKVSLGIGIASSAIALGKGLAALKSGGGAGAGGEAGEDGGGKTSAPSFNLVAGSGSNQIAQGLSSQQQPIQAVVISGDMTTAQSVDRNIVTNSTI